MIVCFLINDAAEELLGRSPSINTAKVKAKTVYEKINRFVYICAEKCIGSLLYIITIKKHAVHNIHRLTCGPYAHGPPGICPACPCVRTTLVERRNEILY